MVEDYRVERATLIGTVIMIVVLFITMLSFFGIIDFNEAQSEYCKFLDTKMMVCNQLKIGLNTIDFYIINNGKKIEGIKFEPDTCFPLEMSSVERGTEKKVTINCGMTAAKGKTFKQKIKITYKEQDTFDELEITLRIKGVVET